jgi:hypothetical protein
MRQTRLITGVRQVLVVVGAVFAGRDAQRR